MQNNNNNHQEIVFFGKTNYRNKSVRFGIKTDDRRRHMYLIGKTGMGKSTVLENMIVQDIKAGRGVALVDPHGDFAEKILDYIPSHRAEDVVYFNPADVDYPIAFNVMESVAHEHKHLIASGLIGVFKKLWADTWGPRLEYVLRNAILALLDYPESTLLGVMRILADKNFRKKVVAMIQDPVVKAFWEEEYSKYPDRFQAEAIAPIQNKVGQFLSTTLIRNIVGQIKSSISIHEIMDNNKILIMNLSKGRIGEDSSSLLGAMMITKIQLAAMRRIEIPEEKRNDFYLYVDEFQNFATESFAHILSEARKYRLNLIIAHQYIDQLDETVRAAVFGNVGTIICFRVGAADAEFLVKEFSPYFNEEDLVNLPKYHIYTKLMIDGVASAPFSAITLEPLTLADRAGLSEQIIALSRRKYGTQKNLVEEQIANWMIGKVETPKKSESPTQQKKEKKGLKYTVKCYECGKPTEVNFKPDGIRPVYCKSCFQEIRQQLLQRENEIEQPAVPEISLTEAIQRQPTSFKQTRTRESSAEKTKQSTENKMENKTVQESPKDSEKGGNREQIINPGEIIHF